MVRAKNEAERLQTLKNFKILDTPPEDNLDDIVLLATKICGFPIGFISLTDENRQWLKSKIGIIENEFPRSNTFCDYAIVEEKTFIVENAMEDDRFKNNPMVSSGYQIRSYAGAPLISSSGFVLGVLCVVDQIPQKLSLDQIQSLEALSRQVVLNFERKKLELDLLERELFLKNIVGMLPDLVTYVDTNYVYKYANPAYGIWFNVDTSTVIGKKVSEVVGEAAFLKAKPFMDGALNGDKQEFSIQVPYLVNEQVVTRLIKANYIPDTNLDGKVIGVFAVISDITHLKEAERIAIEQSEKAKIALKQLQDSEKSFHTIFDHSPIGIIQLNSKLQFVSVNEAFFNFLGYTESELRNKIVVDFLHPDELESASEALTHLLNSDQLLTRRKRRYIHKSGKIVLGLATTRLVEVNSDEYYFISVIEDITEIQENEEKLKLTQSKLISATKMALLGEMAGGIAHEINNPLAIIDGKASLLLKKLNKKELDLTSFTFDLNVIRETIVRISKIIKGLKTFSRSSENDPMEVKQLLKIIEETFALCHEKFKISGIKLTLNCNPTYMINCRSAEISQVLMNLLSNAYDAIQGKEEKWITVNVVEDAKLIKVSVTDSGNGISPSLLDKIMIPFFTTKGVGVGTGLGLSISKGIAESHQGTLNYNSTVKNTCFVLELPKVESV